MKSKLLALKKELKCWESMFERKHGRKPSRVSDNLINIHCMYAYHIFLSQEDIEQSPSEIKGRHKCLILISYITGVVATDTYRQYQRLKAGGKKVDTLREMPDDANSEKSGENAQNPVSIHLKTYTLNHNSLG